MRVLVTCGAGFIGTQVTVAFFGAIEVVVVDDLTRGQVGPLDSRTVFSETFKPLTVEVPSAPLVTVQPSDGIQAYPSPADFVAAFPIEMDNGSYPAIVAAFKAGTGMEGSAATPEIASELSVYSGGGYNGIPAA